MQFFIKLITHSLKSCVGSGKHLREHQWTVLCIHVCVQVKFSIYVSTLLTVLSPSQVTSQQCGQWRSSRRKASCWQGLPTRPSRCGRQASWSTPSEVSHPFLYVSFFFIASEYTLSFESKLSLHEQVHGAGWRACGSLILCCVIYSVIYVENLSLLKNLFSHPIAVIYDCLCVCSCCK